LPDRQERYDEKLIQILENACGVFAEKGYHHATVRDVAAATGVSPAGLYYYFRSKEELLYLILHHALTSLLARVREAIAQEEDPQRRIRCLIRVHLAFFRENGREMRVLAQEWRTLSGELAATVSRVQRDYTAVVLRTLRDLQPTASREELRASAMGLFGMLNWLYQWYQPERDLTVDELSEIFGRIFLRGFLSGQEEGRAVAEGPTMESDPTPWGPRRPSSSVLSGPGF